MADFDFILNKLKTKSSTKQLIYKTTCDVFTELKNQLQIMQQSLGAEMEKYDKNVEIKYSSHGNFEAHLKFSGDTLVFMMHTNVFNFDDNQYIHRTDYVKEDPMRSYCGLIQIYNFLSDSIKYNRLSDVGYLIGRLYINYEKHFFIEGKRPLSLHYHNFENQVIDQQKIKEIIEQSILYCLDFDLLTPPFNAVDAITIEQKNLDTYSSGIPTGKRLGFQFFSETRKQGMD